MKTLILSVVIAAISTIYSLSMLSLAPSIGTSGSLDFSYPVRAASALSYTESEMPLGAVASPYISFDEKVPLSEQEIEDIKLIALVTMAEAEGECETGKRLVIDTILNRRDSEYFPDTIYEVIYQPNQFSCMWNGGVERCEVQNDIVALVYEEMESRLDSECIFFNAYDYSIYGVPMYQVGNHYFSKYN